MADMKARRARIDADLAELSDIAAQARDDLRSLPAKAQRTPAQKATARRLRTELVIARAVLNALGRPDNADLDDAD